MRKTDCMHYLSWILLVSEGRGVQAAAPAAEVPASRGASHAPAHTRADLWNARLTTHRLPPLCCPMQLVDTLLHGGGWGPHHV